MPFFAEELLWSSCTKDYNISAIKLLTEIAIWFQQERTASFRSGTEISKKKWKNGYISKITKAQGKDERQQVLQQISNPLIN